MGVKVAQTNQKGKPSGLKDFEMFSLKPKRINQYEPYNSSINSPFAA